MFDDDSTVDSGSNQQLPSDAFDSRTAIGSTRAQDVPKSNPDMSSRGAADFAVISSIDPPSVISSLADPAASPAASTPTAAFGISADQDAPTPAVATSGYTSSAPAGIGNLAALGPMTSTVATPSASGSTASANSSLAASPDGAGPTAPSISDGDHSGHVGSADQVAPSVSLDSFKQLFEPTPSQATTDSGSTSVVSPATPDRTLGPMLGGPPDVASLGTPPSDGGIATVHPDGDPNPKALDTPAAIAPMTKAAAAGATSIPSMIESGAKAILLSAHDGSVPAAGVVGSSTPKPEVVAAPAAATPSITPEVLAARDQLASAIATASPTAAAITTSPTHGAPAALVPTLGADTHALHMHGG